MIVLVLEDDPLISMIIEEYVSVSAEVVTVASRADARAQLSRHVDLAILDVDVTNGQTFDIAALLDEKQVPFVFVSGSNPQAVPPELRHAPFIPKPFDEADIRRQVERVAAARR
jgi:DNA-binding response OmpR family regulator